MRNRNCLVAALAVWLVSVSAADAGNMFGVPDDRDLPAAASASLKSANASTDSGADYAIRVADMVRRYDEIEFDPEARAAQLPEGVEPAFNYVRDHIRFEGYAGAFRGAGGTYCSRAGNAADRALLLARLLKAKGIETRLVTGQLPPEKAEVLFDRMFAPADASDVPPSPLIDNNPFAARIKARATRDYAVVRGTLGADLPADAGIARDAVLKEIASHVWLQAKVGDGWVDLDTAFPDATPGKVYASDPKTSDVLPDEAAQRLTIRVIAERLEGDALKQQTVFEQQQPVTNLMEKQIFVLHGPAGDSGGVGGLGGGNQPAGLVPILWIEGASHAGKPIDFGDAKVAPSGGGPGVVGGFGRFGGALGGGGGAAANTTSKFVAEYLEFELSIPGRDPQIVRRTLIDRGGAAWRMTTPLDASKLSKLDGDAHGPFAAQTIHNIWISGGPHDLASFARAMQIVTYNGSPAANSAAGKTDSAAPADPLLQLWLVAMKNLACLLPTDHWFLPALNDMPSARFYLDSPRILVFSLSARKDGADHLRLESEIDWRRDQVRGVARDPAASPDVARRKIWYGLLEGALEHEIAAEEIGSGNGLTDTRVASTSASLGHDGLTILRPADAGSEWTSLAHNPETAARLSAALKSGDTLVIPKSVLTGDGPAAWWALSPSGADTRAVWGNDVNASVVYGGAPYGGSSGPSGWELTPDGRIVKAKPPRQYSPAKNQKGDGNEYITLTIEISIKSLFITGILGWFNYWLFGQVIRAIFH